MTLWFFTLNEHFCKIWNKINYRWFFYIQKNIKFSFDSWLGFRSVHGLVQIKFVLNLHPSLYNLRIGTQPAVTGRGVADEVDRASHGWQADWLTQERRKTMKIWWDNNEERQLMTKFRWDNGGERRKTKKI